MKVTSKLLWLFLLRLIIVIKRNTFQPFDLIAEAFKKIIYGLISNALSERSF